MYRFEILTQVDAAKWNEDLKKSSSSTFFQTVENLTPPSGADYFPIFVYVYDENGNVAGQLGLQIVRTVVIYGSSLFKKFSKFISKITNKGVWVYGPIIHVDDKKSRIEVLQNIMHAVDIISKDYDLVHVLGYAPPCDPLVDDNYKQELIANGYIIEDFVTFIADLNKNTEELWKNVSKKARGDVNRAKKRNITTKEISDLNDFNIYMQISHEWAKTKGLQIADPSYQMDRLWNNYKTGLEKFFLAYQDGKAISGLRISCFNGIAITNTVVNSYSEHTSLGGTLLTWNAIEATKNAGMKIFDFTGQKKTKHNDNNEKEEPENPLLFYKKKWGGEEFPCYLLLKIRKKYAYAIYKILFKIVYFYHNKIIAKKVK